MTGSPPNIPSPGSLPAQTPVQGPLTSPPLGPIGSSPDAMPAEAQPPMLPYEWRERLGSVLWQLGHDPEVIDAQLDQVAAAGLSETELTSVYGALAREVAIQHANDAWSAGTDIAQLPPRMPGPGAPVQSGPPFSPPQVPPPDAAPPTRPAPPTGPPAYPAPPTGGTPPPPTPPHPGPDREESSLAPWLVGAGLVGAGVLGAVAFHDGGRNVRALRAMTASYDSGAMHQGGLQAINDARLGARFNGGIGLKDYASVALPGINRIGSAGRLTSVARGHLDHAELLASATGLRGVGNAVSIHEPTRRVVLEALERGRPLRPVIDDLKRSAGGVKGSTFLGEPQQLVGYWDNASVVERGRRAGGGNDVTSGATVKRPELALERDVTDNMHEGPRHRERYRIVETGGTAQVDELVAGRGARLGGRGLASGIGTIQGVNVSTLNPAMQANAIRTSRVDPAVVAKDGLAAGFTARWRERLTPPGI